MLVSDINNRYLDNNAKEEVQFIIDFIIIINASC